MSEIPAVSLKPEDVDRLGEALLTLTRELWVMRDRQIVLERLLVDAGVLTKDQLDTLQPDEVLTQELGDERARLVNAVLQALDPGHEADRG